MKKIFLFLIMTVYIFAGTINEAKKLFDDKQYKEALIIFNEHEGNSEAQYYLGKSYLYGLGVKKDEERAFEFSEKSAKGKSAAGINLLGVIYEFGHGVEKDELKALKYYKQAVELGNTLAMANLAGSYQWGTGIEKDLNKAIYWYEEAAKNGKSNTYKSIGDIYYFALKDHKSALKYYLKFKKHYPKESNNILVADYPSITTRIGLLYLEGNGIDQDEMNALMYLTEGANAGDSIAMAYIGEFYKEGRIVKKNYNKSLFWFEKVVSVGDNGGYFFLGDLYQYYLKDDKKAIENYILYLNNPTKPAFKAMAYEELGHLYLKLKDYMNAYKYFLLAAKSGNYNSAYNLLDLIDKEPKLENKREEALEWVNKSLVSKDIEQSSLHLSQSILYHYYSGKASQMDKAIKIATDAYRNGNFEMGCNLAQYFGMEVYGGQINKKINYKKAYDLADQIIKKSPMNKGVEVCYFTLSSLYLDGKYFAKDTKKAIYFLKEAFKHTKASKDYIAEKIAKIYLEQLVNYAEAEKWFKKAYQFEKNPIYLTVIEKYKKDLPKFNEQNNSKIEQKIFPVIENFNGIDQTRVAIDSEQYYFLASDQKDIKVYDKKSFKLIKTLRGWNGQGHDGIVTALAFDEKKQWLYYSPYLGFTKNAIITVFDIKANKIIKTINNPKTLKTTFLSLSNDGKYLLAINDEQNFNIINTDTDEIQAYTHFTQIGQPKIGEIVKKKNDYLVNILLSDKTLHTYSIKQKRHLSEGMFNPDSQVIKANKKGLQARQNINNKLSKNYHNSFNKLFLDKKKLYLTEGNDNIALHLFDMEDLKLVNIKKKLPNRKQKQKDTLEIKYKNNYTGIDVYEKNTNKLLSTIDLITSKILRYQVLDNKYILIVTNDVNRMLIFNLDGKPISELKGFLSIQNNILYYKDGYLFSAGDDKIIHIWNLDYLVNYKSKKSIHDPLKVKKLNQILGFNILRIFNDKEFIEEAGNTLTTMYSKLYKLPFVPTVKQLLNSLDIALMKMKEINPIASLYIKNDDWIIYNEKGFYTGSKNGKNLIKYHLNQGLYKEAKIIANDQIFEKFYRPDLIKKILAKENVDEKIDVRSILLNVKPPEITIIDKSFKGKKNLELRYKICDAGSGVSNISMIRNGISANLYNSRGFTIETRMSPKNKCEVYKNVITLEPGKNTITVKVFDKEKIISNISEEITVEANYKIGKKPNLHFVSLAVSNYRDEALQLKYPVSDVLAVKEVIEKKSKNLFSNIYTYDLHDKNVTKENLNELFTKVSKKVALNDVFVMYIAGHGVTSIKDGLFYFLPQDIIDTSVKGLAKNAISVNDIKNQLGKIAANKSLILIDTCDSGSFVEHVSRGLEQRMAAERLAHATGRNYIVASSKNQAALEGYKNHGVFTYTVLDAFDKAYFGNSTILMISSLATFIQTEVPKITSEKFHYEQFPQKYLNGNDFPIGEK